MIGSIISAGASLIGGMMGRDASNKANEMAAAEAAENRRLQKEFAQSGIQWKVADARAAGIHPLYAMGASTPSYAPVSSNFHADTSLANAFSSAGQDIGRAVNTTRSSSQRNTAFNDAVQKLSLEKMGLENEILRSDLLSKTSRIAQQSGPPMPVGDRYLIPGQSSSGVVTDQPMKRMNVDPGAPFSEPGAHADIGVSRSDGGLVVVPSADVKERIEDSPYEWGHYWRNAILPAISQSAQERQTKGFPKPKPGHVWKYIPFRGEYQEVPINEGWYSRARRMWN